MSKIQLEKNETIIGGTIMKQKDTAYIVPVALALLGFFMLMAGSKTGLYLFITGLLLCMVVAASNDMKRRKK